MALPGEVKRELDQVSHRGKAPLVKKALEEATEAFEDGRFEDAVGAALRAKGEAPRSPTVRELLGLAYYRLGRFREAARELAAYKRLSDRRDQDHVYADCERALERPEKALQILEGLTRSDVDPERWVESLIVAAGALEDLGRPERAVEWLERGPTEPREVEPYHLRLWYALADALEAAGRRRDARPWWDAIYNEEPDFFDVADRRLGIGARRP